MEKKYINNVRLGIFVITGFFLLVLSLYILGKNANLFGARYELKTRVNNANGLLTGNNVRFSGIQAGTVKNIVIVNDTTIEITMLIDLKLQPFIAANALVSIGTEGLMGNKVINISPAKSRGLPAKAGGMLPAEKMINTGEMLETLYKTNNTVSTIADGLQLTVQRINQSAGLWNLLNNRGLAVSLHSTAANIEQSSVTVQKMTGDLYAMIHQAKLGKGAVGAILSDTQLVANLDQAVMLLRAAGSNIAQLTGHLNGTVQELQQQLKSGGGMGHALLYDSVIVMNLQVSLDNIRKGTDGFNQNMEALKHNFFFRGYFRKLEKQNKQK